MGLWMVCISNVNIVGQVLIFSWYMGRRPLNYESWGETGKHRANVMCATLLRILVKLVIQSDGTCSNQVAFSTFRLIKKQYADLDRKRDEKCRAFPITPRPDFSLNTSLYVVFILIVVAESWILDPLMSYLAECQPQLLGIGDSLVAIDECVREIELQLFLGILMSIMEKFETCTKIQQSPTAGI